MCELKESDFVVEYIHVTGHAYVILSQSDQTSQSKLPPKARCVCKQTHKLSGNIPTLKTESHIPAVARRASNSSCNEARSFTDSDSIGFHWMRNFLLNKKWKLQAASDERLYDALLADFVRFCSNDECRLEDAIHEMMTEPTKEEDVEELVTIPEIEGNKEDQQEEGRI